MVTWEQFTCAACPLWKQKENGIQGTCQLEPPKLHLLDGKALVGQLDIDHSCRCAKGFEFLINLEEHRAFHRATSETLKN